MEVVFVKDQAITFLPPPTSPNHNEGKYQFRSVDVNLLQNHADSNPAMSKILEMLQRSDGGNFRLVKAYLPVLEKNELVKITVGISLSVVPGSRSGYICKGVLKVQDAAASGVLKAFNKAAENRLTLNVNLSLDNLITERVYSSELAHPVQITATLNDTDVIPGDILENFSYEQNIAGIRNKIDVSLYWRHCDWKITGTVTVTAVLPDVPFLNEDPSIGDKLCINSKLLNEEIACGVNIVLQNGVALKCHKGFLSAHSTVFQTMFQTSMKESHTSTVEIFDMEESSVRAFLAYLYYWEIKEAEKNSLICFELLHAGHKYDIVQLEECMKMILLSKSNEWYDVDVGLRLFLFARNLEEENELKMKSIQILKSKFGELKKSECYQERFKKDPNAAMELCEYAFSL